jgi:hypothetical protein
MLSHVTSKCQTVVWLTSWSRVLLEKLIITQLVKKFATFYGTRKFITIFARAQHWTLLWIRWIHSTSLTLMFEVQRLSALYTKPSALHGMCLSLIFLGRHIQMSRGANYSMSGECIWTAVLGISVGSAIITCRETLPVPLPHLFHQCATQIIVILCL